LKHNKQIFTSSHNSGLLLYIVLFCTFLDWTCSSANLDHILVVVVELAITQLAIIVPQARTIIIAPVNEDTLLSHPDDDEDM
jgi:hypothetical protein